MPTWSSEKKDWVIDFRVDGKRIRRCLGIRDRTLRSAAVKKAQDIYKDAWKNAGNFQAEKDVTTFKQAAELYIQQGGEERFLPKIVKHFGPHIRVDEISHLDIARAARTIYPEAKPETVRRQLRVPIKAVQNFAAGKRRERIPDTRRTRWLYWESSRTRILTG